MPAKRKKEEPTTHRMGKRTWYEIRDGKYHIAPTYSQSFEEIGTAKSSVDEVVRTVNNYAAQQYTALNKREKAWWDSVLEDLGLEKGPSWTYDRSEKCIYLTPKNEEEDTAQP
jgi:hypothetical protein